MVPIAIYCCLRLFHTKPPFIADNNRKLRFEPGYTAAAVLIGITTEYYAFYTCFLLTVAGISAWLYHRKVVALISSFIMVSIITTVFVLSLLPNIIFFAEHGRNSNIAARSVYETERYALKISQMLLPVKAHRNSAAAAFTDQYAKSSIPSSSEGSYSALGILGTIGFISLVLILFNRSKECDNGTILGQLSTINIAAVLYGTVGGFATMFALFVSPLLRAHARISIFIAFFSIAAFFLLLQKLLLLRPALYKTGIIVPLAIILTFIGIYDQSTSANVPHYNDIRASFDNDADFVRRMESLLPAGSMVFQLPFSAFPEQPKLHNLTDYELGKPYLHSHSLRWSYGAMLGRKSGDWQKAVTAKPLPVFLDEIRAAGFKGLYIDRRGYEDNGAKIESELRSLIRQKPQVNRDGNNLFFLL